MFRVLYVNPESPNPRTVWSTARVTQSAFPSLQANFQNCRWLTRHSCSWTCHRLGSFSGSVCDWINSDQTLVRAPSMFHCHTPRCDMHTHMHVVHLLPFNIVGIFVTKFAHVRCARRLSVLLCTISLWSENGVTLAQKVTPAF